MASCIKKLRRSSLLVGAVIKSSASTLGGSGFILSAVSIMPQKLISLLAKLHFSGFSVHPASLMTSITLWIVCVLILFLMLGSSHHVLNVHFLLT